MTFSHRIRIVSLTQTFLKSHAKVHYCQNGPDEGRGSIKSGSNGLIGSGLRKYTAVEAIASSLVLKRQM